MNMKTKVKEQIIYRACATQTLSAGVTAGITMTSVSIDRVGFNSAYFIMQGLCGTAALTISATLTLATSDTSTGTYTLVDTATWTISTTFTSAATTAEGLYVDLSAFNKVLKAYVTFTATLTSTISLAVTCALGDALVEPAV